MWVCLGFLAIILLYSASAMCRLTSAVKPASAPAVDHGPLPASVRSQVLVLVGLHLENADLQELHTGKVREFRISGKPRALLAQEFYAAFRPLVVAKLMPLLRPYGEIISFDITALDLPPARLRDIPDQSSLGYPEPSKNPKFTIADCRLPVEDDRHQLGFNRKSKIEYRISSPFKDS